MKNRKKLIDSSSTTYGLPKSCKAEYEYQIFDNGNQLGVSVEVKRLYRERGTQTESAVFCEVLYRDAIRLDFSVEMEEFYKKMIKKVEEIV